jgi:hypothetical protein
MRTTLPLLVLAILIGVHPAPSTAQDFGNPDSLRTVMRSELSRLSSDELEARKARRRWFQQRGYANVLYDAVRRDGFGALIAYLRMVARLELALPQDRLYLYVPVHHVERKTPGLPGFTGSPSGPVAVPLHEPREFPVDPWQKESP